MPQVTSLASRRAAAPAVKGAQARADKLESRRVELAEATLETLAELGCGLVGGTTCHNAEIISDAREIGGVGGDGACHIAKLD